MEIKNSKNKNVASTSATPTPEKQSSGDFFDQETLVKTLTELNQIFDKHHKKYPNRKSWRKGIIENLAAWKLGIK